MFARLLLAAATSAIVLAPFAVAAQPAPAAAPPAPPAAAPAAPAMASPGLVANGAIVATLRANPHFSILVKALDATNLTAVLANPQLTLFAPTDEAFQSLPAPVLTALMQQNNLPTLQHVLAYHLIHADLDSSKIRGAKGPVPTVEGQPVQIDGTGPVPMVNDAHVIQLDVHPTNGYIYVIDKVLVPSDVTLPQ